MAKLHNKTVQAALSAIIASGRVTPDVGKPLVEQGLIEVNVADVNEAGAALARLTEKGTAGMPKTGGAPTAGAVAASEFSIMKGIVMPASKRGAGRVAGPSKYPFDTMEAGDTFFVANTDKMPDALKSMNSAVANANNKHRVDTGKTEQVQRTKRDGKKAALDAAGNKIKETVTVAVYEYPKKFVVRGVKAGQKIGEWVVPADGALVGRDK